MIPEAKTRALSLTSPTVICLEMTDAIIGGGSIVKFKSIVTGQVSKFKRLEDYSQDTGAK